MTKRRPPRRWSGAAVALGGLLWMAGAVPVAGAPPARGEPGGSDPLATIFADDFEDGVLPVDWTYERGSWEESGGSMNGVPDDLIGSQIKARAIASPAFEGCRLCTIHADVELDNVFGAAAEIHLKVLGWYVGKDTNVSVSLKPAQNKIIYRQKRGGKNVVKIPVIEVDFTAPPWTVDFQYDGDLFHVTVNGALLLSVPNALSPEATFGTVGFQSRNGDIHVNDLTVTN